MTITNGYCTLAELKAFLPGGTNISGKDTELESAVTAASRAIDNFTHRRFYAATDTRYYSANDDDILFVDDLLTVTTLKTDEDGDRTYEITWATTDYDLKPDNAVTDGQPYTWIELAPNGNYAFPTQSKGVQIAGSFGYASTAPAAVKQACLIQAARYYMRALAIFGTVGGGEMGTTPVTIPALDPDVQTILQSYTRLA